MIRLLLTLLVLSSPVPALARPSFELLTFGPGDSLWERFGHTALLLRDDGLSLVYSFGHARFGDPSFGYHFLRGEAQFSIVTQPWRQVRERYERWDRTVEAQRLFLPEDRVAWLRERLDYVVTPPHDHYRYDQLYDNCSTRVRDLLDEASGGALRRAAGRRVTKSRFRDYTLEASRGHWFAHWGLDLIGGPHQDLSVSGWEEMFIPEALKQRTLEAQLIVRGRATRLSSAPRTLYARKAEPALRGDPYGARKVGGLLAVLLWLATLSPLFAPLLSAFFSRAEPGGATGLEGADRLAGLALLISGAAMAIAGSMVLFLVLISKVHDFAWNENLFVFCPLDVMIARYGLRMLRKQSAPQLPFLVSYLWVRLLVLALYVLLSLLGVFRQHNAALASIAALLLSAPLLLLWARGNTPFSKVRNP